MDMGNNLLILESNVETDVHANIADQLPPRHKKVIEEDSDER